MSAAVTIYSSGLANGATESDMNAESRTQQWIEKSAQSGNIIHIGRDAAVTAEELTSLLCESEDSADNTATAGESEYWGTTESGATWRVHVEMDC